MILVARSTSVPVVLALATATLGACATSASAPNGPPQRDLPTGPAFALQVDAGLREFRGDTWDGLDDQAALGLTFVCAPEPWPIALEAGVAFANARGDLGGDRRDTRTLELSLGLRHEAALSGELSFAAGAGAFAARTVDHDGAGWFDVHGLDADGWYGWYLHGGVYYAVGERVRLGVDVRWCDGSDPEIEGVTRNGDSTQYALSMIVGF